MFFFEIEAWYDPLFFKELPLEVETLLENFLKYIAASSILI